MSGSEYNWSIPPPQQLTQRAHHYYSQYQPSPQSNLSTGSIDSSRTVSKVSKPQHNNTSTRKTYTDKQLEQMQIDSTSYNPSDPNIDISIFTIEDIIILKNLLSLAEIHKWKHISNRLSKARSKKLNTDYCINKFHQMYNLPFNPKNSLLNSKNYLINLNSTTPERSLRNGGPKYSTNDDSSTENVNYEGMLGSSIPYIVSKDGWNSVDDNDEDD